MLADQTGLVGRIAPRTHRPVKEYLSPIPQPEPAPAKARLFFDLGKELLRNHALYAAVCWNTHASACQSGNGNGSIMDSELHRLTEHILDIQASHSNYCTQYLKVEHCPIPTIMETPRHHQILRDRPISYHRINPFLRAGAAATGQNPYQFALRGVQCRIGNLIPFKERCKCEGDRTPAHSDPVQTAYSHHGESTAVTTATPAAEGNPDAG